MPLKIIVSVLICCNATWAHAQNKIEIATSGGSPSWFADLTPVNSVKGSSQIPVTIRELGVESRTGFFQFSSPLSSEIQVEYSGAGNIIEVVGVARGTPNIHRLEKTGESTFRFPNGNPIVGAAVRFLPTQRDPRGDMLVFTSVGAKAAQPLPSDNSRPLSRQSYSSAGAEFSELPLTETRVDLAALKRMKPFTLEQVFDTVQSSYKVKILIVEVPGEEEGRPIQRRNSVNEQSAARYYETYFRAQKKPLAGLFLAAKAEPQLNLGNGVRPFLNQDLIVITSRPSKATIEHELLHKLITDSSRFFRRATALIPVHEGAVGPRTDELLEAVVPMMKAAYEINQSIKNNIPRTEQQHVDFLLKAVKFHKLQLALLAFKYEHVDIATFLFKNCAELGFPESARSEQDFATFYLLDLIGLGGEGEPADIFSAKKIRAFNDSLRPFEAELRRNPALIGNRPELIKDLSDTLRISDELLTTKPQILLKLIERDGLLN